MRLELPPRIGAGSGTSASIAAPILTWAKWSLLAALGYGASVRLGMALTLATEPVSTLWPANAVLALILLVTPPRKWWVVLLFAFPAHLLAEIGAGVPLLMSALWFVSNSTEAALCATLLLYFLGGPPQLDQVRDVSILVAAAGIVAPALSSFLDAGFVAFTGWRYTTYWQVWGPRTLSNSLGALIVIPLIVAVSAPETRNRVQQLRRSDFALGLLLLLGLSAVSAVVFHQPHVPNESPVLIYAPLPFLIVAAVRFGTSFVALSTSIVAVLAIEGLIHSHGPFMDARPERAALALQTSLVITSVSLMLLAAALAELRNARSLALSRLAHLDLALNAAQMGTWQWDGNPGRISWTGVDVRGSATVRTGSLLRREFLRRVARDDRSTLTRTFGDLSSSTCDAEFRFRNDDGSVGWISAQGRTIPDQRPGRRRMIGVYADITQRKSEEAQAAARGQQLAQLNRVSLLGVLSGALAHDLLQPLTAMLCDTEAALFTLRQPPSPSQTTEGITDRERIDDALEDIRAGTLRITEIIRNTRALFERGEVNRSSLDVNECIEATLRLEKNYLIARGTAVDTRLAVELPLAAIGSVELQQVVINLVVNACEAMSQVPEERRRIEISTFVSDGGIEIVVADNGAGLANTERIFDPFFTSKPHGTGLGLTICRTIVAAHGGRLWAANQPKGGASLHVRLPVATASNAADKLSSRGDDQGSGKAAAT